MNRKKFNKCWGSEIDIWVLKANSNKRKNMLLKFLIQN